MTGEHVIPAQPGSSISDAEAVTVFPDDLLATVPDETFDRIASLAARLFDVPVAVVSIREAGGSWYTAPPELEALVTGGDGAPMGAGTLLGEQPCSISDTWTDPRTVDAVWSRQMRSYAAAPILDGGGRRVGAVEVFDVRPREFSEAELSSLRELSEVVWDGWRSLRSALAASRRERELRDRMAEFATAFQRTLLPPALPPVPGLQLACHYHAASPAEVTGDFYDVFPLGDGRWAFFLGDVAGHGVQAAAVTSLTRYTLRTAALHRADPAAVLEELNKALLLDRHTQRFCTVLFGTLRPDPHGGFDVVLATGGHPPAMLLRPGREHEPVRAVRPPGGMLVGAFSDAAFATTRLHLTAGESLLLYTDGLIEARPAGESFGEQGLVAFLRDRTGHSASELIAALTTLIGSFGLRDDVALLALHVPTAVSQDMASSSNDTV